MVIVVNANTDSQNNTQNDNTNTQALMRKLEHAETVVQMNGQNMSHSDDHEQQQEQQRQSNAYRMEQSVYAGSVGGSFDTTI